MIAAGNVRVLAGITGPITIPGLPFTPRRLHLRAAATAGTPPLSASIGLWSADRPDTPQFPQQACIEYLVSGGNSLTTWSTGAVAHVRDVGGGTECYILVTACTDNTIVLSVYTNTLTNILLLTWVATP